MAHRAARNRAAQSLAFPHADFRPGQRALAESVYKAVSTGRCRMAQAPPGRGKTLANKRVQTDKAYDATGQYAFSTYDLMVQTALAVVRGLLAQTLMQEVSRSTLSPAGLADIAGRVAAACSTIAITSARRAPVSG